MKYLKKEPEIHDFNYATLAYFTPKNGAQKGTDAKIVAAQWQRKIDDDRPPAILAAESRACVKGERARAMAPSKKET